MEHAQVVAFQQLFQTTEAARQAFEKAHGFANPSDFHRKKERDWPEERTFRLERLKEEQARIKEHTERLAKAWPLYVEGKYTEVVTVLMGTAA
jgi:hypothetical protein